MHPEYTAEPTGFRNCCLMIAELPNVKKRPLTKIFGVCQIGMQGHLGVALFRWVQNILNQ